VEQCELQAVKHGGNVVASQGPHFAGLVGGGDGCAPENPQVVTSVVVCVPARHPLNILRKGAPLWTTFAAVTGGAANGMPREAVDALLNLQQMFRGGRANIITDDVYNITDIAANTLR